MLREELEIASLLIVGKRAFSPCDVHSKRTVDVLSRDGMLQSSLELFRYWVLGVRNNHVRRQGFDGKSAGKRRPSHFTAPPASWGHNCDSRSTVARTVSLLLDLCATQSPRTSLVVRNQQRDMASSDVEDIPKPGDWPVPPQEDQPIHKDRIWIDGCFDFSHHGELPVIGWPTRR